MFFFISYILTFLSCGYITYKLFHLEKKNFFLVINLLDFAPHFILCNNKPGFNFDSKYFSQLIIT
jgi:hypothetical protein